MPTSSASSRRRSALPTLAALLVASILLLAACGGGSKPTVGASPSSRPTTTTAGSGDSGGGDSAGASGGSVVYVPGSETRTMDLCKVVTPDDIVTAFGGSATLDPEPEEQTCLYDIHGPIKLGKSSESEDGVQVEVSGVWNDTNISILKSRGMTEVPGVADAYTDGEELYLDVKGTVVKVLVILARFSPHDPGFTAERIDLAKRIVGHAR